MKKYKGTISLWDMREIEIWDRKISLRILKYIKLENDR